MVSVWSPNCVAASASSRMPSLALFLFAFAGAVLLAGPVGAQAFNYPSMQLPTASVRDYTGVIAGGGGTTMLLQWREGAGAGQHVGLDVGFADPRNSSSMRFFAGASGGRELMRASTSQPVDLMLTAGASATLGGPTLFRVPVGVSAGHTFELDQEMTVTPFVHPRLSLDLCNRCGHEGTGRSEVSLNFDLGANFRINHEFAVRAAMSFSGSNLVGSDGAFGVGFNWTPSAVSGALPGRAR